MSGISALSLLPIPLMAKGFDSKASSHDIISFREYGLSLIQEGIHDRKREAVQGEWHSQRGCPGVQGECGKVNRVLRERRRPGVLRREGSLGYFEVMLEQILHEVKTVAEGHCILDEKLERFHKETKEDHQLAIDLINHPHDVLKEEIQGVRTELKEEIHALDRKLTGEIRTVGDKVNGKAREGALGQKVDGHEDRIVVLERKVA
jgi:hypothetical protein